MIHRLNVSKRGVADFYPDWYITTVHLTYISSDVAVSLLYRVFVDEVGFPYCNYNFHLEVQYA